MKKLVVIGLGETAMLAYEYFTHDSDYEVVAFAVDKEFFSSQSQCDLPVITIDNLLSLYPTVEHDVFVAMGSGELNRQRTKMYRKMKALGYTCASYISSRAFVWKNAQIGENCFILEDNTIQPFTTIGNNVFMWSGNHLGHRSVVQDNCFITSHVVISGFCDIGENSFIGVNATIADKVSIGKDNFVGMGSIINKNTDENAFYAASIANKLAISAKQFSGVQD